MVGRKPAIPPLTIIEAILEFKDRIVFKNDDGDQSKYIFNFFYIFMSY